MKDSRRYTNAIVQKYLSGSSSAIYTLPSTRLIFKTLLVLGGAALLFLFPIGTILGLVLLFVGIVVL